MDPGLIARLERVLLSTWRPLEVEEREGWTVVANEGLTGRANSLSVVSEGPADRFDDLIRWVEAWYRSRRMTPAARMTPLSSGVDAELAERGYRHWKAGATVMVGPLGVLADLAGPGEVQGHRTPTPEWEAVSGDGPRARATLAKMRARSLVPERYAEVTMAGGVVAIGRGAIAHDHLMISGMATMEHARGQGLARSVMADLARWALDHDAATATLQVEHGNDRARRLYERIGFEAVYDYRYVALEH